MRHDLVLMRPIPEERYRLRTGMLAHTGEGGVLGNVLWAQVLGGREGDWLRSSCARCFGRWQCRGVGCAGRAIRATATTRTAVVRRAREGEEGSAVAGLARVARAQGARGRRARAADLGRLRCGLAGAATQVVVSAQRGAAAAKRDGDGDKSTT